jgi:xanthine dehydrogenase YagS FAD-binding subunit
MRPFQYVRATDEDLALAAGLGADASYIAGGTTLVDLMKLEIAQPATLVDLQPLPLATVELAGDGLRIGAMARNSDVAYHPLVKSRYPVLSQALLSGASPQLRNMATVGGNLLQRTRCSYFRDIAVACNKRRPGSGCSALEGYNRGHAVLGGSEHCIATHPSDMCVALLALDAVVHTRGRAGTRAIPIRDFHTLPGDHPEVETVLERGELVTHVHLPASSFAARSHYRKVRDRASYAFALASAAVALALDRGVIAEARVVLGGVATKPWRSMEAEKMLVGQPPGRALFQAAAEMAVRGAVRRTHNGFKVELAQRTLVRALSTAGEIA